MSDTDFHLTLRSATGRSHAQALLVRARTWRPTAAVAATAAVVMAAAQIAIPLTDRRAGPTVVAVSAAAVAALCCTALAWGWRRAAAALAIVAPLTLAIEWIGSTTGVPFGPYDYTGVLQPELFGVPAVVPLAWFAVGLPAREVASRLIGPGLGRIVVAATVLTAWDVFLDPQMVAEGYWVWEGGGVYRDVPLSNFGGWLISAAVVLAAVEAVAPNQQRSLPLVGLYTWWAVMQTLGFLLFFGDPLVAVLGGAAMGVPTYLVWRRPGLVRSPVG